MTFEIPNNTYNPNCPDSSGARKLGIQCVGMRYNSTNTTNLINNEDFFDFEGYAFVLKPLELRYVPTTYTSTTPLGPEASFNPRTITLPLGLSSQI